MSLSSEPAETSSQPADGADPCVHAPRLVREIHAAPRRIVPLLLPTAPQLVPAAAPVSAKAAARRPTGPELLAEDEVLKRLLQRHSPDPQPLPVRPARDTVGLALGMIARLIVAGCAVAVAALLLLGVVPLPFRLGGSVASETPVVAMAPAQTVALAQTVAAAPPAAALQTAAAAPPAAAVQPAPMRPSATPVATLSVHAGEAVPADRWALDAAEIERLVKRGEDYLAQGDIAAARLILGRAAEARDARAAMSLGATYDPAVLRKLHVLGFRPDVAQARAWYDKAAGYGSSEAAARLATLPRIDH